jgi:uncharacterized protein YqjF (DUF2071 family)
LDAVKETGRIFLTAEWRHLAMLNYEVDPGLLRPLVPTGTELDSWNGQTLVTLVGFLFLGTRVLGVPVPLHRDFEEVNLRFYVRRKAEGQWRRAVVFVQEIVPRVAVAWVARVLYGENYRRTAMSHQIEFDDGHHRVKRVSYSWKGESRHNRLEVCVAGDPHAPGDGTIEEFITNHYWGCSRRPGGGTVEYQVEHPRWRCWQASGRAEGDLRGQYGDAFSECFASDPRSALLAEGSPVKVYRPDRVLRD